MSLGNGVSFIQSYLQSQQTQTNQTIFSANKAAKNSSQAQLNAQATSNVSTPAQSSLGTNPVLGQLGDAVNSAVTSVSQQLLVTASTKAESAVNKAVGINVRQTATSAMNSYYSLVGLISTAGIDFALAIARLNGNQIISLCNQKVALITQFSPLITQLRNLTAMVTNATPFFTEYYQKLIIAYNDISSANTNFQNIVKNLQNTGVYDQLGYQRSITLLQDAEALILPPAGSSIASAFSGLTLSNITANAKQALGAAMAIPVISAQIAALYIQYVEMTVEINTLLTLYVGIVSTFLSSFKNNPSINNNTINHITSGIKNLSSLQNDMANLLIPEPTSPITQAKVTSSATMWGVRLATIIQWFQLEPGLASNALTVANAQVALYEAGVTQLQSQGNINFTGGQLVVQSPSEENVIHTTEIMGLLLLNANTTIATQQSPANAAATVNEITGLLSAAKVLCTNIITALTPFCTSAQSGLTAADQTLQQVMSFTKGAGLDRAADLLQKGDMANFFSMTGQTATYAGLGAAGCASIISVMSSNPNTSSANMATMQNVQASYNTQMASKQVEMTRSTSSSTDIYTAQVQQNNAMVQAQGQQAISIAQNQQPATTATSTTNVTQQAQQTMTAATGNTTGTSSYVGTGSSEDDDEYDDI